jgi:hypothetical protein
VLAVVLALLLLLTTLTDIAIPSVCQILTPDDWFAWWFYDCGKDAGGGGGGGAS